MNNKTAGIITLVILVLAGAYAIYSKKNTPTKDTADTAAETGEVNLVAGRVVGSVKSDELGEYLTDYTGMTLYAFAGDKKLESRCNDDCLKNWIPYRWDATQKFETMTNPLDKKVNAALRSDDTRQYAYGEQPLYYYAGDTKPGDTNGNGLDGGKWSIVPVSQ